MRILFLTLAIAAPYAAADRCNFDELDGHEYQLGALSASSKFQNDLKKQSTQQYPYLSSNGSSINADMWAGLAIKIPKDFQKTLHQNYIKAAETPQYFTIKGTARNCLPIELNLPLSNPKFSYYTDPSNILVTGGHFPLTQYAQSLNLVDIERKRGWKKHIGQSIYWLRTHDQKRLPVRPDTQPFQITELEPLEAYTLVGIDHDPFFYKQNRVSYYGLKIRDKMGITFTIPDIPTRIASSSPWSKNTSHADRNAILSATLFQGMNADQLALAWGIPRRIEADVAYKSTSGQEIINYSFDDHRYRLDKVPYRNQFAEIIGYESRWYYPERLGDIPIVVDKDGQIQIHKQSAQVRATMDPRHP
ncbi:hypothetical protein AB6D11_06060 [Vibrio splendidus]